MNDLTTSKTLRPRRRALCIAAGLTAGAVLAVGVPLAASAHVGVTPDSVAAGGKTTLTFAFSHGCAESPTTALVIDVPEGVANVTPIVQGGWRIERELGSDGIPTRVTFHSDEPVESGLKATVSMDVLFAEGSADSTVSFPVVQQCVEGATAWTEVAEDGQDPENLEHPAPAVAVGGIAEATDDDHVAHGTATASTSPAAEPSADEDLGANTATGTTQVDVVARWLGGLGLAAGIAALTLVLVRRRSPRG